MTLKEMAIQVLKDKNIPLSSKEIWAIAEQKNLINELNIKGKTPKATFRAMLYMNENCKAQQFVIHQGKPKKFSLKVK